ncbi:ribonuclease H-like domain-containing protein, partial [Tanacetum coccineum]
MSVYRYTDDEYEADDLPTLISKLDMSCPLHLHPNDSVALTVVSIKLKGTENYQVWSCAMLLALEGKNKTSFIDGSCMRSNTNEVLGRQWDRVNAIVLGWIWNSISEELFLGQIFSKRAKHVWEKLKETYDKFLMGLDDCYMQIRSNILSRDDLPNVRYVYAIISSKESHRVVSSYGSGTSQRPSNVTRPQNSGSVENSLNSTSKGVQANMAGANQHLTYTDKDLVNVIDISYPGITVSHPNGTKACITKVGNMVLNKTLTLYDVLVVLKYCVSLMFVHKVARDNNLIVPFDKSNCFVLPQDLRDMKVLGTGNQIDGLYYFNETQVHLDLWGPYKVVSKEVFKYFLTVVDDYTRAFWVYMIKTKDEPSATPLYQNLSLSNEPTEVDKVLDNVSEYQRLIGKPLRSHLKIALKVLRYLKGNPGKGIHIVKQPKASLEAFVDADWAKCLITRKSVTGF